MDHGTIDRLIARRREWGRRVAQGSQPGSWAWKPLYISDQDCDNLHAMCEFFLQDPREYRVTVFGSMVYTYTSDPSLIDDIERLDFLDQGLMRKSQVRLVGTPDTIVQKNPQHVQRSFFRNLPLTVMQQSHIRNLLMNQTEVRIGPALKTALEKDDFHRCMDYFFIDHDDDSILVMLSLIIPNLIRKTLPITAYK
jgi:hypothetical protein